MTSALGPAAAPATSGLPEPVLQPQIVGIDYGTSSSSVAWLDADGVPRILPDRFGKEFTPSTLTFCADGGVRVGQDGGLGDDAEAMVRAIKRHLGDRDFAFAHGGQRLSAEVLSALILRRLGEDAERRGTLGSAILTVPSYFFAPNRRATWATARLANLPVTELLAEPVAAALAHVWRKGPTDGDGAPDRDREQSLLVFDMGGGTFDVTIVRVRGGRLVVAATEGDNSLGGVDWTERLVDFAAEKFKRRHGADPRDDYWSYQRLFDNCEAAKCRLSRKPRAVIEVSHEGVTMPLGLSRDEFHQITHDLLERAQDAAEFLFESSGIDPDELDEVLLVGGGSQLPCIGTMIQEICGRPVVTGNDPQRCVVEGAAIYAAALAARGGAYEDNSPLQRRLQAIQLGDVNAHSIGIALDDPRGDRFSRNHILIPRNSMIPRTAKARFVTSLANPEGIALRLIEGEAPEVSACTTIAHWRILGLPADLPAGSPIEVTLRCDSAREVTIEARQRTGQPARVERVTSRRQAFANDQQTLSSFRLV